LDLDESPYILEYIIDNFSNYNNNNSNNNINNINGLNKELKLKLIDFNAKKIFVQNDIKSIKNTNRLKNLLSYDKNEKEEVNSENQNFNMELINTIIIEPKKFKLNWENFKLNNEFSIPIVNQQILQNSTIQDVESILEDNLFVIIASGVSGNNGDIWKLFFYGIEKFSKTILLGELKILLNDQMINCLLKIGNDSTTIANTTPQPATLPTNTKNDYDRLNLYL
ncbi:12403_t:CDS:2, partial [Entrophospora sp. SA101]